MGMVSYGMENTSAEQAVKGSTPPSIPFHAQELEPALMTAKKMLLVLEYLHAAGYPLAGIWIGVTSGSELAVEPNGQLYLMQHKWMLKKGFIFTDNRYIYRPLT